MYTYLNFNKYGDSHSVHITNTYLISSLSFISTIVLGYSQSEL